jgi:hypothetical protein
VRLPLLVAYAWLCTPFACGALIARSARARDLISARLPLALTLGWAGVAALIWGVTALDTPVGVVAFAVGGPLAGLSFWLYDDGGEGGDGGGGQGPPDEPPEDLGPSGLEWDWAAFERELEAYTGRETTKPPVA